MIRRSFLSNLEMSWLLTPNFFPNRKEALESQESICIGTKSRNVGDSLLLTPLAEGLKRKYPRLRVFIFPRAFNPASFYGNPFVQGIRHFPRKVFGDDCSWGEGNLIQQKQRFFDLPVVPEQEVRPHIFLTSAETAWATRFLNQVLPNSGKKPLCAIHPSGLTWKNKLPIELWTSVVQRWKHQFNFLQFGLEGDTPILGSTPLFFKRNSFWDVRKLFAITSQANLFIGVNSGPMHAARAFLVPSLILIFGRDPEEIFKTRSQLPYFLRDNFKYSTLYQANKHIRVDSDTPSIDLKDAINLFLSSMH